MQRSLSKYFRASDLIFRVGGEEFIAIIYNADKTNATQLAEKLRSKYENRSLIPDHPVTISIGVSCLQANMDWEQWMKQADDKMYQAKENGRNQVAA